MSSPPSSSDRENVDAPPPRQRRFRVALSFPGTTRDTVEPIAQALAVELGRTKVLYDRYHEAEFSRPNLDVMLPQLYTHDADLIVVFICPEYAERRWCNLEFRHVRQLLSTADEWRIMFLAIGSPGDLSKLGILPGDGFTDIAQRPPDAVARLILERMKLVDAAASGKPRTHQADDEIQWNAVYLRRRVLEKLFEFWNSAPGPNHFIDLDSVSEAVIPKSQRLEVTDSRRLLLTGVFQSLQAEGYLEFFQGQCDTEMVSGMRITQAGIAYLNSSGQTNEPPLRSLEQARQEWRSDRASQANTQSSIRSNASPLADDVTVVGAGRGAVGKTTEEASKTQSRPIPEKHYVFLVHGIRDNGAWINPAADNLCAQGYQPIPVRWEPISAWKFALPGPLGWFLYWYPRDLYRRYQQAVSQHNADHGGNPGNVRISYIAHSFGCWAVTQFLRQPNVAVYRVILCGSVARFGYQWPNHKLGLNANGSASGTNWPHVLNNCAIRDPWPGWAWRLSGRYGTSGRDGFSEGMYTYSRWFEGSHGDALERVFWNEWVAFLSGTSATNTTASNPLNRDQPPASNPDFRGVELIPRLALHAAWFVPLLYCLLRLWCGLGHVNIPWPVVAGIVCPACAICDSDVHADEVRFASEIQSVVVSNGLEREYPESAPQPPAFADPNDVTVDFVNDRDADIVVFVRDMNGPVAMSDEKVVDHWRAIPLEAGQRLYDVRMSAFSVKVPQVSDEGVQRFTGDYAVFVFDCKLRSLLGGGQAGASPVHRLVPPADSGKHVTKILRVLAHADAANSFVSVSDSFQ